MIHNNYAHWSKTEYLNTDTFWCAITRFNVRMKDFADEAEFQAFSESRVLPFLNWCVKSVQRQIIGYHKHYVLFDETWARRAVELAEIIGWDRFCPVIVPRDHGPTASIVDLKQAHLNADAAGFDFVASTRLDSDDMLATRYTAFVDDMIAAVRKDYQAPLAINFPYQLRKDGDRVGVYVATVSAESTTWEPAGAVRTGYSVGHHQLRQAFELFECGTKYPMVLVNRHASNIGFFDWHDLKLLADPEAVLQESFGIGMADLEPPAAPNLA